MEYGTHFLFPSSIFAAKEPHKITTVLGSCIAICLYDPVLKAGGMNHFMLPLWNGQGLASPKYGNIAIAKLIENLEQMGCKKTNLQAKVFGGAHILHSVSLGTTVGMRNIDLSNDLLKNEGIRIFASSVGGNHGRRIIFDTFTGEVLHQFIRNAEPSKK